MCKNFFFLTFKSGMVLSDLKGVSDSFELKESTKGIFNSKFFNFKTTFLGKFFLNFFLINSLKMYSKKNQ